MQTYIREKIFLLRKKNSDPVAFGVKLERVQKKLPQPVLTIAQERLQGLAHALAKERCRVCFGSGLHITVTGQPPSLCMCVKRKVFQIVFSHYQAQRFRNPNPQFELTSSGIVYGIPAMEFRADFELTARRVLDSFHHKLFRIYCLEGRDMRDSIAAMGCDRGHFFHSWYRVQQQIGEELLTMSPSLFPVSNYFHSNHEIRRFQFTNQPRTKWPPQKHARELHEPLKMAA